MSTFTEYKESLQAREEIAAAVLRHTEELCEVLEQNFVEDSIKRAKFFGAGNPEYFEERLRRLQQGKDRYKFYIESGRKYHKIIMETDDGNRSAHAFVDKKTGEIYKPASYKAPAKHVRFDLRIIEQRQWLFDNADWAGGYLYIK